MIRAPFGRTLSDARAAQLDVKPHSSMAPRSPDDDRALRTLIAAHVDAKLASRATRFTAPVFAPDEAGLPEIVGTCLTVRIGEDHILFTAGHVLDVADDRPIAIVVDSELREIRGDTTRFRPVEERAHLGDHIDVGALLLETECTPHEELSLDDLELVVPARAKSDSYMVMGYPCSKNRKALQGEEFNASLYHFLTVEATPEQYQELNRSSDDQIALLFNRKDVWRPQGRVTAPDLYGVSGGGVWHLAPESDVPLWKAKLAAVAVEWHDRVRVKHVLATRIRPLIALLATRYPRIGDAVAAYARDAA